MLWTRLSGSVGRYWSQQTRTYFLLPCRFECVTGYSQSRLTWLNLLGDQYLIRRDMVWMRIGLWLELISLSTLLLENCCTYRLLHAAGLLQHTNVAVESIYFWRTTYCSYIAFLSPELSSTRRYLIIDGQTELVISLGWLKMERCGYRQIISSRHCAMQLEQKSRLKFRNVFK